MKDLLEDIYSRIDNNTMREIDHQLDINDQSKTQNAINAALAVLTKGLANNVSSSNGAASLQNALESDHDGGIMDKLNSILVGLDRGTKPKTNDGIGILKHIFGTGQNSIIGAVSKMTGLSGNQIASILVKLAPVVLAYLGRANRQAPSSSSGGIVDILTNTVNNRSQNSPSIFERLFDRDNDGSVMDEFARMGMDALGGYLVKR